MQRYSVAKRPHFRHYINLHRRRMKRKAIEYKGGKCEICGYGKCVSAMEFHHPDPKAKDFNISQGSYGWEKIRREVDKCQLLCCRCHREIHAAWEENRTVDDFIPSPRKRRKLTECHQCGRSSKRKFCSKVCSSLKMEKTTWPNDEDLARIVWEQPVTRIASELGVSDRAVQKRCRIRGITTPGQGYWSGRHVSTLYANVKFNCESRTT